MCCLSWRRYKSSSFRTSDARPHSLACFHLAGLPELSSGAKAISFGYWGAILESENRKATAQVLHCSRKRPFSLYLYMRADSRAAGWAVPLTRFQVLCDGGNLQVTIKMRLSNTVENTQLCRSLRSLIKTMKSPGRHKKQISLRLFCD